MEIGINFIDTADHNNGNNEEILATALKANAARWCSRPSSVICAPALAAGREVEGKPEYVSWACDNSLRRLQTDYIDLYYLHRVDPKYRLKRRWRNGKLVEQGKVRHLGLSEAGPQTIRALTQFTRSPPCRASIPFGP